jgi:hypothetical protein
MPYEYVACLYLLIYLLVGNVVGVLVVGFVCSLYIVYICLNIGLCISLFVLFICVLFLIDVYM